MSDCSEKEKKLTDIGEWMAERGYPPLLELEGEIRRQIQTLAKIHTPQAAQGMLHAVQNFAE